MLIRVCHPALSLLPVLLLSAAPTHAQTIATENQKVRSLRVRSYSFAQSMALRDDVLVLGASEEVPPGVNDRGVAYVYRLRGNRWALETRLVGGNPVSYTSFGDSVATSGERIVVGAPRTVNRVRREGAAHIFRFDGSRWIEEAILRPRVAVDGDLYSRTVAIGDEVVAVSSVGNDDVVENGGCVTLYRLISGVWTEEQKLVTSNIAAFDRIGEHVAVGDGVVALSSERHAVHVFRHDGVRWNEEQILTSPSGLPDDRFGASFALDGDHLLVGAPLAPGGGTALLYRFDGVQWVLDAELGTDGLSPSGALGGDVSLSGDYAVVGDTGWRNAFGNLAGAVFTFRRVNGTWYPAQRLRPRSRADHPRFPYDTEVSGGRVVVTAGLDNAPNDPPDGIAYLYRLPDLGLRIDPASVASGGTVNLQTSGGTPGSLTTWLIKEVNGVPIDQLLGSLLGPLDVNGERLVSRTLLPGLTGLDVTLQAIALDPADGLISSREVTLQIQ